MVVFPLYSKVLFSIDRELALRVTSLCGMSVPRKLAAACILATVVVSFAAPSIQSVAALDQTAMAGQLAPAPAAPDAITVSRKVGAADATTSSPTYLGGNPTKCWNYYYVTGAYAFGIVFQTAFAALMYYYTNRGTYETPLRSRVHAIAGNIPIGVCSRGAIRQFQVAVE